MFVRLEQLIIVMLIHGIVMRRCFIVPFVLKNNGGMMLQHMLHVLEQREEQLQEGQEGEGQEEDGEEEEEGQEEDGEEEEEGQEEEGEGQGEDGEEVSMRHMW
jgi:hypothetical protein